MTVVELLQELRRLKVNISVSQDKLVVDAPAGVITPELAGAIKANKRALLELLSSVDDGEHSDKVELTRAPQEDRLSLTQQRIWAIDQLQPDSTQFNLPGAWWLSGELDVGLLRKAVAQFASHHEIFRRRFISINGSPRVSPPDFTGVDFQITTPGEIGLDGEDTAALTRWFEEISALPFDLSEDPLLRVTLLSLEETRHLLCVVSHSIVWDAWCYDIFLSELGKTYAALMTGATIETPAHQYADFVHWQGIDQARPAVREALDGAIAELEGFGHRVNLPYVHAAPDHKDHSGARFNFHIPDGLRERLKAFTRARGVTPFMVFLSAYGYLLCRYAGHDKALLTIPLRGRERPEFENIPGPFTNNLFFPVDVQGHSFSSLLSHVKQETGRSFGGEVPSFERLIEAIDQNLADSAFFQLQFSYQNVEHRGTRWAEGISMSAGPAHNSDSAHAEISFWMREGAERMDGAIDYRTSMFDEAFIATFFERLLALIEDAIAKPEARLNDLDCGQHATVEMAPAAPPRTRVNTLEDLRSALARHGESPVVTMRTAALSGAELLPCLDPATRPAPGTSTKGVAGLLTAINDLAAGREHALAAAGTEIGSREGKRREDAGQDSPAASDGFSIRAPVGHYSGEVITSAITAWQDRLTDGVDKVLIALPGPSAARLTAWLAVLASGRRLCLPTSAETSDEVSLLTMIQQQQPDLVLLPSPMMEALLELDDLPLEPVYLVWVMPGASRLKGLSVDKALKLRYLLASEATLGLGVTGTGIDWPLTFGCLEQGITARVLDPAGRDQLSGLDGQLALSLQGQPATGGTLPITARLDCEGQIRWPDADLAGDSGESAAGHLAASLIALDAVNDAYVEVRRSNLAGRSMIAWVEQALRKEKTSTELRRALRAQAIEAPSLIINVDKIARDKRHRVVRQALDHPDRIPEHSRFEPPATAQEIAFSAIWKDVLSIDRISVNDTFANLGGSSVQALVILSETQKQLGCSFEPRLLFFQTLKQISATFTVDQAVAVPE